MIIIIVRLSGLP